MSKHTEAEQRDLDELGYIRYSTFAAEREREKERSTRRFGYFMAAVLGVVLLLGVHGAAKEEGRDEGKRLICNELAVPVDDCPVNY